MYHRHKDHIYHLILSFIEYFLSKTKMTKVLIYLIRQPFSRATKPYICDTLKNMATWLISGDIGLGVPFLCIFVYFRAIFHLESSNLCQNQYHIRNQYQKLSQFSQVSNDSENLYFFRKKYPYSPSGIDEKLICIELVFFQLIFLVIASTINFKALIVRNTGQNAFLTYFIF